MVLYENIIVLRKQFKLNIVLKILKDFKAVNSH